MTTNTPFDEYNFLCRWTNGWNLQEHDKNKEAIDVYRDCLKLLPGNGHSLYRTKLHINIAVALEKAYY